jgi:hypothetical protein
MPYLISVYSNTAARVTSHKGVDLLEAFNLDNGVLQGTFAPFLLVIVLD